MMYLLKLQIRAIYVLLIVIIAFGVGIMVKPLTNIQKTKFETVTPTIPAKKTSYSPEEEASVVVTKFENLHKLRNSDVIKLFTPPATTQEAKDYSFMMSLDLPPISSPRLYITNYFSYRVVSHKILKITPATNGFSAEVEEERQSYDNTGGGWGKSWKKVFVFELVKVGINTMIDKYYPKDGKIDKYSGLNI